MAMATDSFRLLPPLYPPAGLSAYCLSPISSIFCSTAAARLSAAMP